MHTGARIFFTVTNDLTYDQRMIRICNSLAIHGYRVTLVGRKLTTSAPLSPQRFHQKRLSCFFTRGPGFYAEFNIRLFFWLLFSKLDLVCAIDLDTIIPCYLASRLKNKPRVYDAHELFCEMQEIATRPRIYAFWKRIEKFAVPRFRLGYTVNQPIAGQFLNMYGVEYAAIRNIPLMKPLSVPPKPEKYILYQGAVNEGRCFETLIPAMREVNARLLICGDGNFKKQAMELTAAHGLQEKIVFKGMLAPPDLERYTREAWAGVTLFEKVGLSNYFSLANRFFDYLHAGIPQVCVDYPVYNELNNHYQFAVLIPNPDSRSIADALNVLLTDESRYLQLQQNCLRAREVLNWQHEEKTLISFYENI